MGATNVARSFSLLGILTLVLDALKGVAAVTLTREIFPGTPVLAATAALFAIIGHVFPVWLHFRGGKGVATGLGAFIVLAPKSVLFAVAIFVAVVFLFRYVYLGSVLAVLLFPLLVMWIDRYPGTRVILLMAAGSVLIVLKHFGNIQRLIAGTERRFSWNRG